MSTFFVLYFLFASLCFHYDHLDNHLHGKNGLRGSPVFVATGRDAEFRKYALVAYPWTKTAYTPFFTGIPPHVMMMVEIEKLKMGVDHQTCTIVEGMKTELDKRNIGGYSYQATMVLDEVKRAHDELLNKLNGITISVAGNSNRNVHEDPAFDAYFQIDNIEDQNERGNEVHVHNDDDGQEQTRGLLISWNNCRDGFITLLPKDYQFPQLTLSILLCMWYCGDRSKNIPPYRIITGNDLRYVKSGSQKLSMMKKLVKHVERAAHIVNLPHLVVRNWTVRHVLDLYNAVKHLFAFPSLMRTKKRRLETISWKTYYNILCR